MLFERRAPVPAAKAVDADDCRRPVIKRVSAQRPGLLGVGVGEHLIRERDGDVVFASEREQVSQLTADCAQGLAFLLFGALEPVEPGRAVEDDQVHGVDEPLGVADGFLLFLEGVRLRDDDPRGDLLDRVVAPARELFEPVDGDPLGVDQQRGVAACGQFDGRREHDVRLARGRRPVNLRDRTALEAAAEQLVDGPTAGRDTL